MGGAINLLLTLQHGYEDAAISKTRDGSGAMGSALLGGRKRSREGTPGIQQILQVGKAALSERNAGKMLGGYVGSYVPQAVQAIARGTDDKKRDDGGFVASIAATIPGLRETLPEKKRSPRK